MGDKNWDELPLTDSARRILGHMSPRASDRGLRPVDAACIPTLALWSLLLWERKVGRVALEKSGVDPFSLARDIDHLLEEQQKQHPVVLDRKQRILVFAKTGEPCPPSDFDALLEPLAKEAERQSRELEHAYIGSEHLVLAIIRLADPSLVEVLGRYAISYERLKARVRELLGN